MTYVTCDIETAKQIALLQDPNQAVLFLGPHGVGKSQIVYQIAAALREDIYKDPVVCATIGALLKEEGKMGDLIAQNNGVWGYELGIPVIERRLSQVGEGELTGVPRIAENELLKRETTKFTQMDFMGVTYEFPVILFFDELNRAFPSLRQATFQIADSKIFLGNRLHKKTRVFVAANVGPMYQADNFDIAEFSRYAVIGAQYDSEAWLKWAGKPENKIHSLVVEFITKEPTALYTDDKKFSTNTKSTDPRAWAKIGNLMTRMEEEKTLGDMVTNISRFKMLVSSIIGPIEGAKFAEYCKENIFFFGVRDIFTHWPVVKEQIERSTKNADRKTKIIYELCHKLSDSLESSHEYWFSEQEVFYKNISLFLDEVPNELLSQLGQKVLKLRNDQSNKERATEKSVLIKIFDNVIKPRARKFLSNDKNGIPS